MKRAIAALTVGLLAAASPAAAAAQEGAGRAIEAPSDAPAVVLLTLLGVAVVLLVAGLGYLYRRERGLDWEFQRPEEPHDDDHATEGAH